MYDCGLCGGVFRRPAVRRWREPRPDGFREGFCRLACPLCGAGEPYFEERADEGSWENPLRGRRAPGPRTTH